LAIWGLFRYLELSRGLWGNFLEIPASSWTEFDFLKHFIGSHTGNWLTDTRLTNTLIKMSFQILNFLDHRED
jgi:hypothetical protein